MPGSLPSSGKQCVQTLRVARVANPSDVRAFVAEAHLEHRTGLPEVAKIGEVEELVDGREHDAVGSDALGPHVLQHVDAVAGVGRQPHTHRGARGRRGAARPP